MVKFKLCKEFNTVEIDFETLSEINADVLEAVYEVLPEYKGTTIVDEKNKPSEAQLNFAKKLGITTNSGMTKKDLWKLINEANKK